MAIYRRCQSGDTPRSARLFACMSRSENDFGLRTKIAPRHLSWQGIDMTKSAQQIIDALGLAPHPEGGHYAETWREDGPGRASGTAIYFLLTGDQTNHWHKVDAAEIWHFYAGAPLILSLSETAVGPASDHSLGPDLGAGQRPQVIVPPNWWQKARSTGDWTLVGCTVSPGFEFDSYVLADPGFDIPRA